MEKEIIHKPGKFLKTVLEQQELSIDVEELEHKINKIDALLKVNGHLVFVEYKPQITPQNIANLEQQLKKYAAGNYIMAIANYISPKAKEILKEKKINYLDRAGNIYLLLPNLSLYVKGIKNKPLASRYRGRAFSKTGGMVVFQFLMNPDFVNAPQRKIAEFAGVSLGTIPKVFEGLRKEGFLIKLDKARWQLIEYEKLLNKWTEVLTEKILPAKYIQRYRPAKKSANNLLKTGNIANETQWGGEPAAALITAYLIPENYSLFTSNREELMAKYKLFPALEGEIVVYEKFWNHPANEGECVHPILVYAQLMATGDSRNMETAIKVFDEYIKPNI